MFVPSPKLVLTTVLAAFGLTLRMPRVNALIPITTSGIGNAAT